MQVYGDLLPEGAYRMIETTLGAGWFFCLFIYDYEDGSFQREVRL